MAESASGLRLVVRGRVEEARQFSGARGVGYRTRIKVPAVDQYTAPGTFEVRSDRRLGKVGEEIEVECDLMGFSRSYQGKDGETVRTAEHVLQAVA